MLPQRQQANGYPIPPPLRSARDVREWAADLGLDPALVVLDDDGYPYEDGESAMSQGKEHARQLAYGGSALRARYEDRPDVFVGWDNYVHGERGGRVLSVAPDLCVAFGALPRTAPAAGESYRLWVDGPAPSFVLEVLSKSTKKRDLDAKPEIYAYMGVAEYWIFDPLAKDVPGHVAGLRLRGDVYEPIAPRRDGWRRSAVLGLDIRAEAGDLRFRDVATGEDLYSLQEEQAMRKQERAMRKQERAAHDATKRRLADSEAEVARLRALLERNATASRSP